MIKVSCLLPIHARQYSQFQRRRCSLQALTSYLLGRVAKRYGNLYFVREEGEDQSILQSLESKTCLRQGGCRVVPGLPREQWILTLITSVVGGLICGLQLSPP